MYRYKNFLSEADLTYIHEPIQEKRWGVFHSSKGHPESHFFSQLTLKPETDPYFYGPLLDKIQETIPDNIVEVERIYFNGHYGGDAGELHTDSSDIRARTFLIYCNPLWRGDWGGGTTIQSRDDENDYEIVYPLPRSAIYFEGWRWHCAEPTNRFFKGVRISLAYKLKVK